MIADRHRGRGIGFAAGAFAFALVALVPAAGPGTSVAQAAPCPRASQPAADLGRTALRRATLCRINHLRRSFGRDPVRRQSALQRVAQRHARVMVKTRCLRPRCAKQPPLQRRIRRSGYLDGARRWKFALNTGCALTARSMVREWRRSRFHRQNMVRPVFKHVGVGVVPRATHRRCGEGWATFAALFAWRVP